MANMNSIGTRTGENVLRTLAREFGTDPAATDATRVPRWPGFLNHKHSPPFRVRLTRYFVAFAPVDDSSPRIAAPGAAPAARIRHLAVGTRLGLDPRSTQTWPFSPRASSPCLRTAETINPFLFTTQAVPSVVPLSNMRAVVRKRSGSMPSTTSSHDPLRRSSSEAVFTIARLYEIRCPRNLLALTADLNPVFRPKWNANSDEEREKRWRRRGS